jgi:hypothetical protein
VLKITIGFIIFQTFGQSPPGHWPGLIESFKTIISKTREDLAKKNTEWRSVNAQEYSPTAELINSSKLHPLFLRSLFIHSEARYLNYYGKDFCKFLVLLESKLLKSDRNEIEFMPLIDSEGKPRLVRIDDYVRLSRKDRCLNDGQISPLFSRKNYKETMNSLEYRIPKNKKECDQLFSDWKKNPYLPYLCRLPQRIKDGKNARKILNRSKKIPFNRRRELNAKIRTADFYRDLSTFFQQTYLENLCSGLSDQNKFCTPYLAKDAWKKIINGELPKYLLKHKCKNLYRKDDVSIQQMKTCAVRMNQSPEIFFLFKN